MGDFVCTDESLTDDERFALKWGDRLADEGRKATGKAAPAKAATPTPEKAAPAKVEPTKSPASGR